MQEKMEEMQQHNMSWIEVQFLQKAVDILCDCRRTLMYTYVFAYYLRKNNQCDIFEVDTLQLSFAKLNAFMITQTSLVAGKPKRLGISYREIVRVFGEGYLRGKPCRHQAKGSRQVQVCTFFISLIIWSIGMIPIMRICIIISGTVTSAERCCSTTSTRVTKRTIGSTASTSKKSDTSRRWTRDVEQARFMPDE